MMAAVVAGLIIMLVVTMQPTQAQDVSCGTNIPPSERTADNKPDTWDDKGCPEWVRELPDLAGCSAADWDGVGWRANTGLIPRRNTAGTLACPSPGHEIPDPITPPDSPGGPYTAADRTETIAEIRAVSARYGTDGSPMTAQAVWMLGNIVTAIQSGLWADDKDWCYRYANFGAYLVRWDEVEDMRAYYAAYDPVLGANNPIPHQDLVADDEDWYAWCRHIPATESEQLRTQESEQQSESQQEHEAGGLQQRSGQQEATPTPTPVPTPAPTPTPTADTSALEGLIQERIDRTARNGDDHSNRIWRGALAAVRGEATPAGARHVDAAFAQRLADGHGSRGRAELSSLWQEIADALNG